MTLKPGSSLLFSLFLLTLFGCGGKKNVIEQIMINGNPGVAIEDEYEVPYEVIDNEQPDLKQAVVVVNMGESVDFSIKPLVDKDIDDVPDDIKWDVDGNPGLDNQFSGQKNIQYTYDEQGLKTVKLELTPDTYFTKYVYVKAADGPSYITVIAPAEDNMRIQKDEVEVDLKLDVSSIDNVSLTLNGDNVRNIDLDDDGYLYKILTGLDEGENIISIEILDDDGIVEESKELTLYYEPASSNASGPNTAQNSQPTQPTKSQAQIEEERQARLQQLEDQKKQQQQKEAADRKRLLAEEARLAEQRKAEEAAAEKRRKAEAAKKQQEAERAAEAAARLKAEAEAERKRQEEINNQLAEEERKRLAAEAAAKEAEAQKAAEEAARLKEEADAMNKFLSSRASIGLSRQSHGTANACATYVDENFSVILSPKQVVELQSFKVYTKNCGVINITITGPNINETIRANLVNGLSEISLFNQQIRLRAGNTYTLTARAATGSGSCNVTPKFESLSNCSSPTQLSSPIMTINNQGKQIIYDFKFKY
ncbi:MAG: cell envelope integrity protein TolA [Bacteroidota bacterium]